MKSKFPGAMWTLGLLLALAMPALLAAGGHKSKQLRYTVIDLGTLPGGTFSQATQVNNYGVASGISTVADGSQHALIWYKGHNIDISRGISGPNSLTIGINDLGQAAVQGESSKQDPNGENFCAYFTGLKCLPFVWQHGKMTQLRLLGGNNGTVSPPNNRGEIPGVAETGTVDPDCPGTIAVNGTGPQVLDFKPVVWGPKPRQIRKLRLLHGDTVGMALWMNDKGEAVGISGTCANTLVPPITVGPHAVLWEKDGSVHDLGNFGGTVNLGLLGIGNVAFSINNRSQVTGAAVLPGNTNVHAFLWSRHAGLQDLGTLPGDENSVGLGINNLGDVAGVSLIGDPFTGSPRAALWHNGVLIDLNDPSVTPDSPMYLLTAFTINDVGEIAGFGVTGLGEVHGFLAVPK